MVGDNYLLPRIKKKSKEIKDDVILTGWVDPTKIQNFFAATDIGTYPADKNIYFDSACPIKIIEYTAAKKPIVSTRLKEVYNMNFGNIKFAEDNYIDFTKKILECQDFKPEYPDLKKYDWKILSHKFEKVLEGA